MEVLQKKKLKKEIKLEKKDMIKEHEKEILHVLHQENSMWIVSKPSLTIIV